MEARAAPGHFPVRVTLTQRLIPPGHTGPGRRGVGGNKGGKKKNGGKKEEREKRVRRGGE